MNVVATAPIPTVSTPSFPFGGAIAESRRIRFSPVFMKMSGTTKLHRRGVHAVMINSKPCAQTTYHARLKTDLQSGTAKTSIVPASPAPYRFHRGKDLQKCQSDFRALPFSRALEAA